MLKRSAAHYLAKKYQAYAFSPLNVMKAFIWPSHYTKSECAPAGNLSHLCLNYKKQIVIVNTQIKVKSA